MFFLCSVGIQRSDSDMGGVEPPYCMLRHQIKHICDNPDTDVWELVEERDKKITIVLTDYFLRHHELGTEIKKVSLEVRMLQKEDTLPDDLKKLTRMNLTNMKSSCLMIRQIVVAQSLLLVRLRKSPCSPRRKFTMLLCAVKLWMPQTKARFVPFYKSFPTALMVCQ